jgi:hypothetical protein
LVLSSSFFFFSFSSLFQRVTKRKMPRRLTLIDAKATICGTLTLGGWILRLPKQNKKNLRTKFVVSLANGMLD